MLFWILTAAVIYFVFVSFACYAFGINSTKHDRADEQREPEPECYIRASDWEFIPATFADMRPGEFAVTPSFYREMKAMEIQRDNEQFWASVAESDEDDATTAGDNWPEDVDLGGEAA